MSKFQLNSNLEDSQWKKLDSHGLLYRIFSQTRNLVYCFQATDLIDLYQEELDFHHFTQRWKRLNLDIEADPSSVIEVIERGMSDGEVEVDLSNSSIQVIFHECDVDLKWQFKLQKLTAKAFYEHVTRSILSLTCQLLDCHENLVDCVKRKDEELEDLYENGAASLSKSTLKTERFNSVLEFVKGKDGKDCDPFDILTNEKFYNLTKNLRGNATEIKPIVHRNETQNRIEEQNEKVLVSPGKNLHVIKKRKIEQPPKSNVTRKKLQKL